MRQRDQGAASAAVSEEYGILGWCCAGHTLVLGKLIYLGDLPWLADGSCLGSCLFRRALVVHSDLEPKVVQSGP